MRILLLGNYEIDGQESMQRFAVSMAQGLKQVGHEARIRKPRALFGLLNPSSSGVGKWLGYVDKFAIFPSALRSEIEWADVVHICDQGNSFYTKYLRFVPNIVTCHDLLGVRSARGEFPQNSTGWTGRHLQKMILKGLSQAQHVVCVSDATRCDLLRLARIREQRVSRIYNALNYPYSCMEEYEAMQRIQRFDIYPNEPFILHVGGNQWYKNRLGVLRIFSTLREFPRDLPLKLVMVGKPWTAEMRQFALEKGMSNVVLELTAVANEDLRALYSTASMLLFPSLEEGFGWPIVEAQACGCPVATSGRPPMNEIGGAAAIYIDPDNPNLSASIMNQTLKNMAGMKESSVANAERFRSGMIDSYLTLYEKVIEERVALMASEDGQSITRQSSCSAGEM